MGVCAFSAYAVKAITYHKNCGPIAYMNTKANMGGDRFCCRMLGYDGRAGSITGEYVPSKF